MNKYLIKLANHLDKKGLHKEADYVDWIVKQSFFGFGKKYGKKNKMSAVQIKDKAIEIYKKWLERVGDAAHKTESFLDDPGLSDLVKHMGLDGYNSSDEYGEVMDIIVKSTQKFKKQLDRTAKV